MKLKWLTSYLSCKNYFLQAQTRVVSCYGATTKVQPSWRSQHVYTSGYYGARIRVSLLGGLSVYIPLVSMAQQ